MLYFFPKREKSTVAEPRVVVVSHGFAKEGVVPDGEIERAIALKRAFELDPERHTFRPILKR